MSAISIFREKKEFGTQYCRTNDISGIFHCRFHCVVIDNMPFDIGFREGLLYY